MSRATGATQGSHSSSLVQDALGRLTSQTDPQGTIGYSYDAAGRRLTMSYPGGVLALNYDYDTAGNVARRSGEWRDERGSGCWPPMPMTISVAVRA